MKVDDALPLHLTAMVRRWRCRKRGLCCKPNRVPLSEIERRRFERVLGERGDPLAASFARERVERHSGLPILPHAAHDRERCAFLQDDELCSLRTRGLTELYPSVCAKFPFLVIHTGERLVADMTFACPTALQLLAEEDAFEVVVEPDGEPPTDRVAWMGDADRAAVDVAGRPIPIARFWEQHWEIVERFRGYDAADPFERVSALCRDLTGEDVPPPVTLTRQLLARGAFLAPLASALERVVGKTPEGLRALWISSVPQTYTLDALPPLDEHALLTRYLLHRLLCPVFYLSHADPRYLLMTLFGMLAHHRIERARGYDPLDAVRQVDRFFLHGGSAGSLYDAASPSVSWRAMASLASARIDDQA